MRSPSGSSARAALWKNPAARWVISLLVFVLAWQAIVWIFHVPAYLLPSPSATIRSIGKDAPLLARHAGATIIETLAGLGMALVLGVAAALTMHRSRVLRDLIYPHLVLSQAVPLIAIAPMILIWFGLGSLSKILVVAFVCFFPLTVNTYEGFRAVDPAYAELLGTFGATWFDRYRHLYVPATLPGILAGAKIAATYSVLGAIVGEWLGGSLGLGVYMTRAQQSFRTDRLFGAILIVMVLSFALFKAVDGIGFVLTPWLRRRDHV